MAAAGEASRVRARRASLASERPSRGPGGPVRRSGELGPGRSVAARPARRSQRREAGQTGPLSTRRLSLDEGGVRQDRSASDVPRRRRLPGVAPSNEEDRRGRRGSGGSVEREGSLRGRLRRRAASPVWGDSDDYSPARDARSDADQVPSPASVVSLAAQSDPGGGPGGGLLRSEPCWEKALLSGLLDRRAERVTEALRLPGANVDCQIEMAQLVRRSFFRSENDLLREDSATDSDSASTAVRSEGDSHRRYIEFGSYGGTNRKLFVYLFEQLGPVGGLVAGDTVLHMAARLGLADVVNALLKAGASTDVCNADGLLPEDVADDDLNPAVRVLLERAARAPSPVVSPPRRRSAGKRPAASSSSSHASHASPHESHESHPEAGMDWPPAQREHVRSLSSPISDFPPSPDSQGVSPPTLPPESPPRRGAIPGAVDSPTRAPPELRIREPPALRLGSSALRTSAAVSPLARVASIRTHQRRHSDSKADEEAVVGAGGSPDSVVERGRRSRRHSAPMSVVPHTPPPAINRRTMSLAGTAKERQQVAEVAVESPTWFSRLWRTLKSRKRTASPAPATPERRPDLPAYAAFRRKSSSMRGSIVALQHAKQTGVAIETGLQAPDSPYSVTNSEAADEITAMLQELGHHGDFKL